MESEVRFVITSREGCYIGRGISFTSKPMITPDILSALKFQTMETAEKYIYDRDLVGFDGQDWLISEVEFFCRIK